jgi:Holliday junction DNA helicase RuvA
MISRVTGVLLEKKSPLVLVDVQGIGYELWCSLNTYALLPELGARVILHTHFLVREDLQVLYGFATEAERLLFRELIKINGIGPRVALTILSGYSVSELCEIIQNKQLCALTRLSGIGQKTGERLLLELSGRLESDRSGLSAWWRQSMGGAVSGAGSGSSADRASVMGSPIRAEAIAALEALGYKTAEAVRAVGRVKEAETTAQAMIKAALRQTA